MGEQWRQWCAGASLLRLINANCYMFTKFVSQLNSCWHRESAIVALRLYTTEISKYHKSRLSIPGPVVHHFPAHPWVQEPLSQ